MGVMVLIWLVCGAGSSIIASGKGRSGFGWFLLGIIFGPLALLAAAISSTDQNAIEAGQVRSGALRSCPHCAAGIPYEARVCRHCARDVPEAGPGRKPGSQSMFALYLIAVLLVLLVGIPMVSEIFQ